MCCKDKDYLTKKQESAVQKCVFAYFLYRFNQKLRFDHFGGDSITTLQRVDLSLGIVAHGPDGEVGRVVGVERLGIEIPWVALWQEEGLGSLPVGTDGRQIDAGVASVVAPTGEEEPSPIAAPVVEAVGTTAVDDVERKAFARLKVEEPQVAFGMPDGEIAIVGEGVHQVSSIVGRSWPAYALAFGSSIDERIDLLADMTSSGIKAHAAEAVAFLVVVGRIDLTAGSDEIEPEAIGRESGTILGPECLHDEGVADNLMRLCIIDKHI